MFDQANVERVVRVKSQNTSRNCWESVSTAVHSISVNVTTSIDVSGKVTAADPQLVTAEGPSEVANTIARCIANDVATWEFPPPPRATSVVLPFRWLRQ